MLFANASKIIRNWFLTLQPDNYMQFKSGRKEGHGCNMSIYALIYALIYLCTCVKERKASLKILH